MGEPMTRLPWCGWVERDGRWVQAVAATSEVEAYRLLQERPTNGREQWVVTRRGESPAAEPLAGVAARFMGTIQPFRLPVLDLD